MEELLRNKIQKTKNNNTLPSISKSQTKLRQILNTENAFKLCRVGVKKSKFINFDLRYTEDQNQMLPIQEKLKIPMMVYNKNKFSPYKIKPAQKSPRLLLVSRVKQSNSLPSIGRMDFKNSQGIKFTKAQPFSGCQPHFYIT